MTQPLPTEAPAWLASAAAWLTPRRVRMQATLLALCLWGVCAVDLLYPGPFDRAANLKFQDFLPFYISGEFLATGRTSELYNEPLRHAEMLSIARPIDVAHETVFPTTAHTPNNLRLPYLYGPQVAILFLPLARLSFLTAASIWVGFGVLIYFACIYSIWKCCPNLLSHAGMITIAALAFPPFFHCFLRGQISLLLLACFTAAFSALHSDRRWLAGIALGLLIFKPQFLVAIPLVLLLAGSWQILAGLFLSAGAQLAFAWIYFGSPVMRAYFDTMLHLTRWLNTAELSLAPIQMHSLRAFWTLLLPWPDAAFTLYVLTALVTIALAAAIWKSASPLALRFSALTLAAVLANPHLFAYDLVVLAPALLLLVDWTLRNSQQAFSVAAFRVLAYLAFVLPLFGPLSRWTHLQLSVPAFAALLWILWRQRFAITSHELASQESSLV